MTLVIGNPDRNGYRILVDVAIVGGGIAGLTAARELCRAGLRVRLFEREERCGGLIQTDRVGAFVIDRGPDTLLAHKPAGIALCRELGLESSFVHPLAPRTTYVVRGGRLCPLPEAPFGFPTDWKQLVATRAFSPLGKLRMAIEPLIPPQPAIEESIGSFVRRRFGQEALTYLAEPLLAGIHRGDASKLSLHALFPTLAEAERRYGSVVLAGRRLPPESKELTSISLSNGLHDLVDCLRKSLPDGVVATGSSVAAIGFAGSPVIRLANEATIHSASVVLAVPAPSAADLMQSLDPALAASLRSIRFATAVNVALGYPRAAIRDPLRGWGFVVPALEGSRVRAASWVSSKWPGRAPANQVLIRASLGGEPDGSVCDESDETVINWAHEDLRRLLGITQAPAIARVYRWPRAIPQLEVGHADRIAAIERRLSAFPGVYITGSGYKGVGIADCITDARAVAARIVRDVHAYLVATPHCVSRRQHEQGQEHAGPQPPDNRSGRAG